MRDTDSTDAADVFVTTDANDYKKAAIGTENTSFLPTNFLATAWSQTPIAVTVTTGNKGEIDITYEKSAGTNALYLDSLSVSESFNGEIASSELNISNIRIIDMSGNLLSEFDSEEANLVEFDAENLSAVNKQIKAASYKKDGTMFSSTVLSCKPGQEKLALGIRVPDEFGQYIELETDTNKRRITLVDIGNQEHANADIYIKKLWVNSNNSIIRGADNSVSMLIKNDGTAQTGKLVLALYDSDGRLYNTALTTTVTLAALSSNYIDLPKFTAAGSVAYAKVFIWEDGTMRPLTNLFAMD